MPTQQFTATADDQFGAPWPAQPTFTWATTAGTISRSGLFTAPDASGRGTVTASSGRSSAARRRSPSPIRRRRWPRRPAATPNPVTRDDCHLSRPGGRRCRRGEPDLHLGHHRHAAGRTSTSAPTAAMRPRTPRPPSARRAAILPGHDHRRRRADGHQQRQRDGEPDAHGDRGHPGDRSTLTSRATQQFTATAEDQFGAALA